MVKKVKTDIGLKRIINVLRANNIHYYLRDDNKTIEVNVGSAKRSTKRFDVCSKLGFKNREAS